jgi:isoleucyl-tRNA synthetase
MLDTQKSKIFGSTKPIKDFAGLKKAEDEVLSFWEEKKIYEKVKEKNKEGKKFYFLQGPPYTSGKIHIGQAWNSSLKDIIMRYKRMKGFDVWDRAGYDMHGLPTEHKVQKKLGLKTKEDIEKYGVDKFVKACLEWSEEHAEYMNQDLWKLGVWMDYSDPYKPLNKDFISGEWSFFKAAYDQDRLYKGLKTMHWDAETETGLAKHELVYKNVKDESVFLKFKKKGSKNEYFIIWTTTPWTIPFNLAIMVNPELDYVKVDVDGEKWILADALAGVFVSGKLGKKFEVVDKFKGIELKGIEYENPLHDELGDLYDVIKKEHKNAFTIVMSEKYVNTLAGTGLVHCAPGCGPEDFEVGLENGIPPFNTLNERGIFEKSGKYSDWEAKKDDGKFIEEFKNKDILVATSEVEHEYPHSDRSGKPVVFRTTEQWFLKTKDLAEKLVEMNKDVYWVPKKSGESYDKWTENLRDNSVARQRYWGCPLPIWVNEKNEEDVILIGSVEELESLTGKKFNDLSVHKPWIDSVIIEKDGKKYKRIPDVADVWIDSGSVSWNCLYNNPELIQKYFPADIVLEATEQTRLWFSMMQICSAIKYGKSAYDNVYTTGMIYDIGGIKMSKSLGNIISPYEVIDKHSADVLRYYISSVSAGENISFSWEEVKVKHRNLIMLGNIANYILDLEKQGVRKQRDNSVEDKWIMSKYSSTLKKVTKLFEDYKLDETISEIEELFILLSRDYIKYVRDRALKDSRVLDVVKEIYLGILKMFAPICPFITDSLWRKMNQKSESVHLSEWPKFLDSEIDLDIEKEFDAGRKVIEKGLKERDINHMGLKWPLRTAIVECDVPLRDEIKEIIKNQLNVKSLNFKLSEKEIKVSLDFKLDDKLEAEGYAREVIRRVQSERKTRGMQKTDRINLRLVLSSDLVVGLKKYENLIRERTGSETFMITDDKTEDFVKFMVKDKEFYFFF